MAVKEIVRLLVVANVFVLIRGHGMMLDPASRNSAWRYFPNRPKQYTDNQLNCGGFSAQWNKNNGKCGVCGDAYHRNDPLYVYPGKFAKDAFITKTYKEGQTIDVKIHITSNHQGFFRFSLGKLESCPVTQEQLKHVLLQPDGSNTWQLHSSSNGIYAIKLVLPRGVLQWWWTVGNNWGCDENGNCEVGLAKRQETFVNCADVKDHPRRRSGTNNRSFQHECSIHRGSFHRDDLLAGPQTSNTPDWKTTNSPASKTVLSDRSLGRKSFYGSLVQYELCKGLLPSYPLYLCLEYT